MVPTLDPGAAPWRKMHAGLVINGVFYARLMQNQDVSTRQGQPAGAPARHKLFRRLVPAVRADGPVRGAAVGDAAGAEPERGGAAGGGGRAVGVFAAWLGVVLSAPTTRRPPSRWRRPPRDDCGLLHREGVARPRLGQHGGTPTPVLLGELGFVGLILFSMFEKTDDAGGGDAAPRRPHRRAADAAVRGRGCTAA